MVNVFCSALLFFNPALPARGEGADVLRDQPQGAAHRHRAGPDGRGVPEDQGRPGLPRRRREGSAGGDHHHQVAAAD